MTDTTWHTVMAGSDTGSVSRTTINNNFAAARRLTVVEIDNTDSPYTAGDEDLIACDCTGGAITVELPTGTIGDNYHIVKVDGVANNVTINPAGSDSINGAVSVTITSQWQSRHAVRYTSTAWVDVG